MIERAILEELYIKKGASMMDIASELQCSVHKVSYWMQKHSIKRRSISEAIYQKHNPEGDPFTVKPIKTLQDAQLFGLGIGLYWGEGNKANVHSVRLGNTDPAMITLFMKFLVELFGVNKADMHFGLQIFSDIDPSVAMQYWTAALQVEPAQFYKPTVTRSGSIGSYRTKSEYGVVTLYYHNKKLRDILVGLLPR